VCVFSFERVSERVKHVQVSGLSVRALVCVWHFCVRERASEARACEWFGCAYVGVHLCMRE